MAAKVASTPDAPVADGPPLDQSPPDLLGLVRTGAVFAGVSVTEVRLTLADGRVQRLMLPESSGVTESPMRRAIIQVVDEMLVGDVLSYDKLAEKAGYSNSGKFRDLIKEYAEQSRRLASHRQGWEKVK